MLLFCYGTLKSGHSNNHYVENGDLLGTFDTAPYYRLFDNGTFPMMIVDREHGYSVSGEVWDIPDEDIDQIDIHEALYERLEIEIDGFDEPVCAYICSDVNLHGNECYGVWG